MDCKHHDGFQRTCVNHAGQHSWDAAEHSHHADHSASLSPREILRLLSTHSWLWIAPAVVCTALAAAYALVAARDWRATQALIVRPEAASVSDERLGKFSDLSEMKTLQETILELAKSQGVVKATLEKVGPPSRHAANWPTALDVDAFRQQIDMRPPGGAEFGKTEVFYLSVLDHDRTRSGETLSVLCNELQQRMQQLRDDRAQSMVAELQKTVDMAEHDLADRTAQLSQFEAKIGADLVELRNLNATTGGPGEVSQELQTIETERRANEAQRRENVRLLALLKAAQDDPSQFLATPNSLLHSEPSLSRLKDALLDAQVRTASLLGTRSEQHPFIVAARASEREIRDQLHNEIDIAVAGLNVELALNGDREQALVAKWQEARDRLSHLAESRADYANLVTAVDSHTKLVETGRKNLADARARQASAHSASVISRIDGVEAGVRPVGPGRLTVTAAGGVTGLLIGFGLVFLFAVPASSSSFVGVDSHVETHAAEKQSAHPRPATTTNANHNDAAAVNLSHSLVGVPITKSTPIGPVAIVPLATSYHEKFGLSQSVPLEEAIHNAEGKFTRRNGW